MYFSLSLFLTFLTPFLSRLSNTYSTNNINNLDTCKNLSLGTYNIHGLPRFITLDPTYQRMETITQKLLDPNTSYHFDVLNIQEDWTQHGNNILVSNLVVPQAIYFLPNYLTQDYTYSWSQWLNDYKHDYSIFGSGLLQLSKIIPISTYSQVFTKHYGYDDIWANKGFQLAQFSNIDIYNTHLDAGKTKGDQSARKENMQQIIDFALQYSKNKAIIIAGDTNLYNNTIDNETYDNLIFQLNLTEVTQRKHIDKIFIRNSSQATLSYPTVVIDDFDNLSDHKLTYFTVEFCYT